MLWLCFIAMVVAWPWIFDGVTGKLISQLPEVEVDLSTLDRKDGLS